MTCSVFTVYLNSGQMTPRGAHSPWLNLNVCKTNPSCCLSDVQLLTHASFILVTAELIIEHCDAANVTELFLGTAAKSRTGKDLGRRDEKTAKKLNQNV